MKGILKAIKLVEILSDEEMNSRLVKALEKMNKRYKHGEEFEELKEIDDIIKFCNGKSLEDIKDTILKYDWEYRIVEDDKGHYWGTDDLRDNRLNFRIRDNIIFEITIG